MADRESPDGLGDLHALPVEHGLDFAPQQSQPVPEVGVHHLQVIVADIVVKGPSQDKRFIPGQRTRKMPFIAVESAYHSINAPIWSLGEFAFVSHQVSSISQQFVRLTSPSP